MRASAATRSWREGDTMRENMKLAFAVPAIIAIAMFGCSHEPDAPFPRAPIVFVSLDTVRSDAVAGFTDDPVRTPVLAELGAASIKFRNAIAASHHTAPSHATMLSGFSPTVHGVAPGASDSLSFAVPEAIPMLAEILRDAGYRTGGFTDGIQLIPKRGFHRGFEVYEHEYSHLPRKLGLVRRFLDDVGEEPFFLFAHTYRAHLPYRAEPERLEELLSDYDGVFAAPARKLAQIDVGDFGNRDTRGPLEELTFALDPNKHETPEDLAFIKALYRASVEGADAGLGGLIDVLKERGVWDKAIVVVTSDHGEAFLEHARCMAHKHLWDEILRVPLLIKLPGNDNGGAVFEEVIGSNRLVPTLLDLVGVPPTVATEGTSFADALADDKPLIEFPVFSAMYGGMRPDPVMLTARTRFFKLFQAEVARDDLPPPARHLHPYAFFDLVNDPHERRNLAQVDHQEMQRMQEALARAVVQWSKLRQQLGLEQASTTVLDPDELDAMRGIGYLGDG